MSDNLCKFTLQVSPSYLFPQVEFGDNNILSHEIIPRAKGVNPRMMSS